MNSKTLGIIYFISLNTFKIIVHHMFDKIFFFTIFLLLSIVIFECKNKNELHLCIASHYSVSEINFFYEMYFKDAKDAKIKLVRWQKDIFFYIEGDTLLGDRKLILNASERINSIKLPIRIKEVKKKKEANLIIRSGSNAALNLDSLTPAITIKHWTNKIDSALIVISNENRLQFRSSILLHELLHVMGFMSHVKTVSNSIMQSVVTSDNILTDNDVRALKLLYEPIWPYPYNKQDFERDFANELYFINGKNKFLKYVKKNHINKRLLNKLSFYFRPPIEEKSTDSVIFKFINPVKIIVKGPIPDHFSDTIKTIIQIMNTATPNLTLVYSTDTLSNNGIFISFHLDAQKNINDSILSYKWSNSRDNSTGKFCLCLKSEISINYDAKFNYTIPLALIIYKTIMFNEYKFIPNPIFLEKGKLQFKPEYKELLKLYYAPELPHNFKKSELKAILNKMQ